LTTFRSPPSTSKWHLDRHCRSSTLKRSPRSIRIFRSFSAPKYTQTDNLVAIRGRTVNDLGPFGSMLEPFRPMRSAAFKRRFQSPFLGAF
jgi:hypothetical protein